MDEPIVSRFGFLINVDFVGKESGKEANIDMVYGFIINHIRYYL